MKYTEHLHYEQNNMKYTEHYEQNNMKYTEHLHSQTEYYICVHVQYSIYTVEVRSLHTLRLESLKLVFQPLHKCIVNKLQFWQVC